MAELSDLNRKRGNIKSQLTRFKNFLTNIEERGLPQLPDRINKANNLLTDFEETQIQIENLLLSSTVNDDGVQDQEAARRLEIQFNEERNAFEDDFYQTMATARAMLNPPNQHRNTEQAQRRNEIQELESKYSNILLPKLALPTFSGNYDQWLSFKDSFHSLIHLNPKLSDIQKFQYLRSSLSGDALQVLKALETSSENYKVGWSLLTERYENRRLIINTHMKELFDISSVQKGSPFALRQFIDTIQTHLRALESLGQPVDNWDTLIIHLLSNRLDFITRRDWEIHVGEKDEEDLPTMNNELVEGQNAKPQDTRNNTAKKTDRRVSLAATTSQHCNYCNGGHFIHRCEEFLKLPVPRRQSEVKDKRLCINCLRKGHFAKDCMASNCKKCSKQHNTLLHIEGGTYSRTEEETKGAQVSAQTTRTKEEQPKTQGPAVTATCSQTINDIITREIATQEASQSVVNHMKRGVSQVILSTAQVYVFDARGDLKVCRALLDPGSQSNLITKALVDKLHLKCQKVDIPISGVSQQRSNIRESVNIKMKSMLNNFQSVLECLVLQSITEPLPQMKLDSKTLKIPNDLRLADPNFNTPGTIDLLIGAGLFWQLLCVGRAVLEKNQPILQKTLLGWVIGGEISGKTQERVVTACCTTMSKALDQQLERFWRVEEVSLKKFPTSEEKQCEQYFKETVKRDIDGRFIVRLPKDPDVKLGNSKAGTLRRFYTLERKLQEDPVLKGEYTRFLQEYEDLGHMSLVSDEQNRKEKEIVYLPHQPVVRTTSLTTKIRVVFDGSARTTTGNSLNDKLWAGPNLQEEIVDIVLRFRCHQYVLTADVAMMFRQIQVDPQDRDLQRILWRKDSNSPVQEYTLNTVTYGTSCAPYLAMRCLKQLAVEGRSNVPLAANALKHDCYMDDILTGCDTKEKAIQIQQQLHNLLAQGQFPLRKWRCNEQEILQNLTKENKADELLVLDKDGPMKTLGLLWDASEDTLQYKVTVKDECKPTKRSILSRIASIYDPLGLIGPILIVAKLMMQELWKLQLSWDETVPQSLYSTWYTYYYSLPKINQLKIPRNVNPKNIVQKMDLHGFCDASEKGYGACIYCTCKTREGQVISQLLCSKSKVAPLKSLSLPRLELMAAVLLAKLVAVVWDALGDKIGNSQLWSDSTIVLCWIKTPPHTLKTFVANRVAEVQNITRDTPWYHVPTKENPADLLSRGIPVDTILNNKLWWTGPNWLPNRDDWPAQQGDYTEEVAELKTIRVMTLTVTPIDILHKYSRYEKLQRIVAYCYRFIHNIKSNRRTGALTVEELDKANKTIIKMIQVERFAPEIADLQANKQLGTKSSMVTLKPFLDEDGLIRVGGRLRHAEISEDQRHPIVLPAKHFVTELIMRKEHIHLAHGGPELLLSSIRRHYWPISGRREARKVTRNCMQCFRFNPKPQKTVMGDIPRARVQVFSRPFDKCGVDYAGPILIREGKRRGRIPVSKAYIAVFVCFSTKAVHLELVTSLTTEAFLAALRRFVSRRGVSSHIYSDNATNFVGANKELSEFYDFLTAKQDNIASSLAVQKITWHFIPPRSPHFGGLWEAAVKSVKRHINIITKDIKYTFEEYYTLLVEIEAILNSRPLTPISSDPNDLTSLTPSHFLTGDSLLEPAQEYLIDVETNRLSRWQHLQQLRQHFWKRWRIEYLHQLQTRHKWVTGDKNLEEGRLVLLIDDNSPPLHWPMGRIIEVFLGEDGVVRVAMVKTSTGTFKRAVRKLCAIPDET